MEAGSLPKISVIIVTYNHEKYISECIENILSQTLRPFEIVICDDHSTDNSWAIICEYNKKYPNLIKAYRHEKNIGQVKNSQFGRKVYTGDLVSIIEGDDRWLPRKLELEWKALQRYPEAKISYSNVYTIDASGNRTGIWYDGNGFIPPSGNVFIEVFSRRFFPNSNSVFRNQLMHRLSFDEEGHCDESLESYWDWDMKIRLTHRFPVSYSGEALVEYRIHGEGFSQSEPEKHFRAMVKVYEKHLPLLENRAKKEAARVMLNVESLLAKSQIDFDISDQLPNYSIRNVYSRNRQQLKDLPKKDRRKLEKEITPVRRQIASRLLQHTTQALFTEIQKGNKRRALKYWIERLKYNPENINFGLLAQILLPKLFYRKIKAIYYSLRGI